MLKPTLVLLLIAISSVHSLSFTLDAEITEMCFWFKGANFGKTLELDYEVIGDGQSNIKFSILDETDNELIYENVKPNPEGKNFFKQDINYKHNFVICWKNRDSEKKSVNFYYKQHGLISYVDTSRLIR